MADLEWAYSSIDSVADLLGGEYHFEDIQRLDLTDETWNKIAAMVILYPFFLASPLYGPSTWLTLQIYYYLFAPENIKELYDHSDGINISLGGFLGEFFINLFV